MNKITQIACDLLRMSSMMEYELHMEKNLVPYTMNYSLKVVSMVGCVSAEMVNVFS